MRAIATWVRADGELAIIHRCERCGALRSNRIAGDDDPRALRALLLDTLAQSGLTENHGGHHDRP